MTLDDLRAFVAVCEAGSLSAVARDLGCTQSAVSQRVKRLEREAGIGLLERRPRGVAPTPAGRILHRAATDGLGGLDLALRRLADMRRGDGGTVRVTTGGGNRPPLYCQARGGLPRGGPPRQQGFDHPDGRP
ncbi:LysR family transcriptional regulator, partial [Streptomyces sp. NPDC059101]|uniref:LysR family transcriptional regulator n=1 Tax=Streptomyces sp. NPDC059101 TaxID=3346728 RepID=UPI0036A38D90